VAREVLTVATTNNHGLGKVVGGASTTIIAALLIAAIGGLITLWRDVGIIARKQETTLEENAAQHIVNRNFSITEERVRAMTDVLTRFRSTYDRKEQLTDEALAKLHAYIIDLQQKVSVLDDHVKQLERAQFGREQKP
jgi:hypothetical protein